MRHPCTAAAVATVALSAALAAAPGVAGADLDPRDNRPVWRKALDAAVPDGDGHLGNGHHGGGHRELSDRERRQVRRDRDRYDAERDSDFAPAGDHGGRAQPCFVAAMAYVARHRGRTPRSLRRYPPGCTRARRDWDYHRGVRVTVYYVRPGGAR